MQQVEYSSCVGPRPIPEGAPEWARQAILEARMRNGGEIRTASPAEERRFAAEKAECKRLLEGMSLAEIAGVGKRTVAAVVDYAAQARQRLAAVGLF
jgi:hypothetical protein